MTEHKDAATEDVRGGRLFGETEDQWLGRLFRETTHPAIASLLEAQARDYLAMVTEFLCARDPERTEAEVWHIAWNMVRIHMKRLSSEATLKLFNEHTEGVLK